MKKLTVGFALMVLLASQTASAKIWNVTVASFSFSPKDITINAGDTVKWTESGGTHSTTSGSACTGDGTWAHDFGGTGTTFQRPFTLIGTFPYFCRFHCASHNMVGSVKVNMVLGILDDPTGDPVPRSAALEQNYPNPFNAATEIYYNLDRDSHVRLVVYDILGRQVRALIDEVQPFGSHHVTWDGTSSDGRAAATGVYFYRLVSDANVMTRKMVLLR